MMARDFFILIGNHQGPGGRLSSNALHKLGLRPCSSSERASVYVSETMPVIEIQDGSLIIGDVFTRDFQRLDALHPALLQTPLKRSDLIQRYWGDYLFVSHTDSGSMTVLRSPSGRIPCFYSVRNATGFITSDISIPSALDFYKKAINWDFIPHSLAYTHLKTERTALRDLDELLPGSVLHIGNAHMATEQAWSPWSFVSPERRISDLRTAASRLRRTVSGAVATFAELDESVLVELSGGLDSSIIASCLRGTGADVSCCTLVTPIPGADERRYAQPVAASLDADLHVAHLRFEDADIAFPLHAASVVPRVAALQYAIDQMVGRVADGLKASALYSGGGGDTIFCYLNTASPAADAFRQEGIGTGLRAIRDISDIHHCTRWRAGRLTLKKLMGTPRTPFLPDASFLAPDVVPSSPDRHPWFDAPPDALAGDCERIFDLTGTQLYGDGTGRGKARPLRFPLLSQPVIECCLTIPTWLWVRDGQNRSIARTAFSRDLPPEVLSRRSKGNFVHYSGTVYERNRDRIRGFLLDGRLRNQGMLDTQSLERFIQERLQPRDERFLRVLDLCMVENWIRHQEGSSSLLNG